MPTQTTTKQEIIAVAIQLFRKQGYYRTSMADLAKATGMTKGAFYHHFANKEEMMITALVTLSAWFEEKVFKIAYATELTPHEKLDKMTELAFKAFTNELGGCFLANTVLETAHLEDTFLPEIKSFFQKWENAMSKIFEEKYANQTLKEVSQQIIIDIEGSLILMQLHKDTIYLQKTLEKIKKML